MNPTSRLRRIEAQLEAFDTRVAWAAVDAALHRERARAMVKMCHLLGVDPDDPRYAEAAAVLIDDGMALQAQDADTLARWRQQEGIVDTSEGARPRVMETLDEMAARLKATTPEVHGEEGDN
jgi:hypothetical protein